MIVTTLRSRVGWSAAIALPGPVQLALLDGVAPDLLFGVPHRDAYVVATTAALRGVLVRVKAYADDRAGVAAIVHPALSRSLTTDSPALVAALSQASTTVAHAQTVRPKRRIIATCTKTAPPIRHDRYGFSAQRKPKLASRSEHGNDETFVYWEVPT